MKLISMTDFVLEQNNEIPKDLDLINNYKNIIRYAKFLSQPLTLGMFLPTDENGNVLFGKPLYPAPDSEWIRWENEEFEFYKAKDRVLFEGNLLIDTSPYKATKRILIDFNGVRIYQRFEYHTGEIKVDVFPNHENMKVEELISENVILSQSAINQIKN